MCDRVVHGALSQPGTRDLYQRMLLMMIRPISSLSLACVVVAVCGCSQTDAYRRCTTNEECGAGELCGGGVCTDDPNATDAPDDSGDESGGDGECVDDRGECTRHDDCCGYESFTSVCVEFPTGAVTCAPRCERPSDCESGCCGTLVEGGGACAPTARECDDNCTAGCRLGDVCCGGTQCDGACANTACCDG